MKYTNDRKSAETIELERQMENIGKEFDRDLAKAMKEIEKDFKVERLSVGEVLRSFLVKFKRK